MLVQGRWVVAGLAAFLAVGLSGSAWVMRTRVEPALFRGACRLGEADAVRRFLARGMDPDIADPAGSTPLLLATANNHTEIVRLLLEAGARKSSYPAALRIAVAGCHPGPLAELLKHGADLRSLQGSEGIVADPVGDAREGLAGERKSYCRETLRLIGEAEDRTAMANSRSRSPSAPKNP